jgi:hypothetical protein
MNTIIDKLRDFQFRVENNIGHKHLYKRFDHILSELEKRDTCDSDELNEMVATIYLLIFESQVYISFIGHQQYTVKCLECAERLNSFMVRKSGKQPFSCSARIEELKEEQIEKNFWAFSFSEMFKKQLVVLKENKAYDEIKTVIKKCFEHSDSGRRPRDLPIEREMKDFVLLGHDLLEWYIIQTNDIDCFPKWHNKASSVLRLQQLYEVTGSEWNRERSCIATSIGYHLKFYERWVEMNPESFLFNLEESFIHQLLKLYDDNKFFSFLRSISFVNSSKAQNIVDYYKDDEEYEIRAFVSKIQNN